MSLADRVEGRVIHLSFDITLIPPGHPVANLGDTDAAMEIGRGLVREAMMLLKAAGEAEGFEVQIEASNVVY
jgi:hypothetical protein